MNEEADVSEDEEEDSEEEGEEVRIAYPTLMLSLNLWY